MRPRLLAVLLLSLALTVTAACESRVQRGEPAPDVAGETLDGTSFRLEDLRGKPVLVNFWGPTCEPCREEFPLFGEKVAEHAEDGFTIVGVLMDDPPEPARAFVEEFGATWPTVVDPGEEIVRAYQVAARPQSYFVDGDGILRSIQIGWMLEEDFDRQYALIAP